MSLLDFLFKKPLDEESRRLLKLQELVGYHFKDMSLLKRALTHKSYANEKRLSQLEQNERYEFLGDAVMELVVSHRLMEFFPESSEGDLSKLRAAVVNETILADLARKIGLGDYLYFGRGEEQCQGRSKDSLLANAFEAVLGAIYLDGGFKKVFGVISCQFDALLKQAQNQDIIRDYKTRLQELSQVRFKSVPRYQLVEQKGPDHEKIFVVDLLIQNQIYGRGEGRSKKQAEQNAAKGAMLKLQPEGLMGAS